MYWITAFYATNRAFLGRKISLLQSATFTRSFDERRLAIYIVPFFQRYKIHICFRIENSGERVFIVTNKIENEKINTKLKTSECRKTMNDGKNKWTNVSIMTWSHG